MATSMRPRFLSTRRGRINSPLCARRLCFEPLEERVALTTLPAGFVETPVATGLAAASSMVQAPDGRIFVTEQGGNLRVIKDGALLPTPFVSLNVDSRGERGLLGVELDPNFASNQFVYVYYTVPTGAIHNRVSRFTASGDVAVPGSETVILELNNLTTAQNHNGGALHFGLDGKLYIGVGENATTSNSQTLDNLLGKLLRINSDGTIPSDNPFFNTATGINRAIWALGLRNPFTFAVQPGSGRIFINDVGGAAFEEINDGFPGANYGWPATEGPTNNPNFVSPVFAYPHGAGNMAGCSIAGGSFYNPIVQQFPAEYVGDYFFADFCNGWIRKLDPATGVVTEFATETPLGTITDVDVSNDGSLLYLSLGNGVDSGTVFRIAFPGNQALLAAGADAGGEPRVRVFSGASGLEQRNFLAYAAGFAGGVRVATGDVNMDGTPDIVTGPGPNGGPHVRVFDGRTGTPLPGVLGSFFAYAASFTGGVNVAAGDVNGDGRADIVTGADAGGGPHVRVFSGLDGSLLGEFFAYNASFTGGVRVAVGNIDGVGAPEIITGAGPGGGPHVRVFSASGGAFGGPLASFFPYSPGFTGGVYVGAGDLNGDAVDDIATGAGAGGGPHVRAFSGLSGGELQSFFAYGMGFSGGVRVEVADANADGRQDIITAAGPGGGPHVRAFSGINNAELGGFFAFSAAFAGGVFVAGGISNSASSLLPPEAPPGEPASVSNSSSTSAATQGPPTKSDPYCDGSAFDPFDDDLAADVPTGAVDAVFASDLEDDPLSCGCGMV